MGAQVEELEEHLCRLSGARHTVTCSSGTDALLMMLMSLGVGAGDSVLVPSFTFAATAEAVALTGAEPVFVDIDEETFNADPASIERTLEGSDRRVVGMIAVDMFGLPASLNQIQDIANMHEIWVISDAAQSLGAHSNDCSVGERGTVGTTTSFFPSKPLGCYGDGGAVFVNDDQLAVILRSIRVHGQGSHKYENVRLGLNSRLDTLQAAVLLAKLAVFEDELDHRQRVATFYEDSLKDAVEVPQVPEGFQSTWAQYTVKLDKRDLVAERLRAAGVPTAVYYPSPLHHQNAYSAFARDPNGLAVSEAVSARVLSLPMHPYLTTEEQSLVVDALLESI